MSLPSTSLLTLGDGEEHGSAFLLEWDGKDLGFRVEIWDACPGAGAVESGFIDEESAQALEAFAHGILERVKEARVARSELDAEA